MDFTAQYLNEPISYHGQISLAYIVHMPFISPLFLGCN